MPKRDCVRHVFWIVVCLLGLIMTIKLLHMHILWQHFQLCPLKWFRRPEASCQFIDTKMGNGHAWTRWTVPKRPWNQVFLSILCTHYLVTWRKYRERSKNQEWNEYHVMFGCYFELQSLTINMHIPISIFNTFTI